MSNNVLRNGLHKSALWLTSVPAGKPAFFDFRLSGTALEYSIPNTRAFLDWLGVRITHHVRKHDTEFFAVRGFSPYYRLSDDCIAALIRRAESVEFYPEPEDLGMLLRCIALQDKAWGFGLYRPQSEIPSPSPEHAEAFWRRWYGDWHRSFWRREEPVEPYHPDFLRS